MDEGMITEEILRWARNLTSTPAEVERQLRRLKHEESHLHVELLDRTRKIRETLARGGASDDMIQAVKDETRLLVARLYAAMRLGIYSTWLDCDQMRQALVSLEKATGEKKPDPEPGTTDEPYL